MSSVTGRGVHIMVVGSATDMGVDIMGWVLLGMGIEIMGWVLLGWELIWGEVLLVG